jgi:hypothetical protein
MLRTNITIITDDFTEIIVFIYLGKFCSYLYNNSICINLWYTQKTNNIYSNNSDNNLKGTLQFWSNLTKIIFQGKHFNYFIVVGGAMFFEAIYIIVYPYATHVI